MSQEMSSGADPGLPGRLRSRGPVVLSAFSARQRLRLLDRAARRLLQPGRLEGLVAEVARESGLSGPVAREVVERMAAEWRLERMDRLVAADFGGPDVLDGFVPLPRSEEGGAGSEGGGGEEDAVRALPDRFAFHVGSGTVPGVGATSLARSLVVGTPVLVKPGAGDRALTRALLEALTEEEPELAHALAVEWWPGGSGELEVQALAEAQRVVVHGSDLTVAALRARLPPAVPLVAHPHRVSLGFVAREVLTGHRLAGLARDMAAAVSAYDQRGCVSPRQVWVESGGEVPVAGLLEELARAFQEEARLRPTGHLDEGLRAGIRQMRDMAELERELEGGDGGADMRVPPDGGAGWTLLVDPGGRLRTDPGSRSLVLVPVEALEDALPVVESMGSVLQSAAVEALPPRRRELAGLLAGRGVTRITSFARQPWPPAWWHHDGQPALGALVRWATLEDPGSGRDHSSS